MERDLSNISIVQRSKEIGQSASAKSIIPCILDGVDVIIKTHTLDFEHGVRLYHNEKNAYLTLQNEDFVPKLLYFDDKNLKLCMTDAGEDLSRLKNINLDECQSKLVELSRIMHQTYNLFHNDLRPKNICFDTNNKMKLIDFDKATFGLPNPLSFRIVFCLDEEKERSGLFLGYNTAFQELDPCFSAGEFIAQGENRTKR